MTRFARVKGEKKPSFNRAAEEATPWKEMKQNLLQANQPVKNNREGCSDKPPEEKIECIKMEKMAKIKKISKEKDGLSSLAELSNVTSSERPQVSFKDEKSSFTTNEQHRSGSTKYGLDKCKELSNERPFVKCFICRKNDHLTKDCPISRALLKDDSDESLEQGGNESDKPLLIHGEKKQSKRNKKVCFHCRSSGHVLSECPQISSKMDNKTANGICYKCGSTEHTLYQCKASGNKLNFANCFICNEVGHLAKHCPDNPRGLYPNGGACSLCGDVTHLKRDCPKALKRKRDAEIKIGILNNNSIEGLDSELPKEEPVNQPVKSKKLKIVKFR